MYPIYINDNDKYMLENVLDRITKTTKKGP